MTATTILAESLKGVHLLYPKQDAKSACSFISGRCQYSRLRDKAFWQHFYIQEDTFRPIDLIAVDENIDANNHVFGCIQSAIPLDFRAAIIRWMGDACQATHWGLDTYFFAVHALDCYIIKTKHLISSESLGPVAAACLYVAANCRETASSVNVMSLSNLRSLCPEVRPLYLVHDFSDR